MKIAQLMIPLPSKWEKSSLSSFFLLSTRTGLLFYIVMFAFGISMREIGGSLATLSVVLYYVTDYKRSNFAKFPLRWLFPVLLLWIVIRTFITFHFPSSWWALSNTSYKSLLLFFAGLESIRGKQDVLLFVGGVTILTFYESLDGVWQAVTGFDFIKGDAINIGNRLSGSMTTPRAGNLMTMIIPISCAIPYILPARWSRSRKIAVLLAVLLPALFFIYGTKTRSGWLGLVAATVVICWIRWGWKFSVPLIASGLAAIPFLSGIISWERLMSNPRWYLWEVGWRIFKEKPVFGWGVNNYNAAVNHTGWIPIKHDADISHPHNVYLQFLVDGGVVGLSVSLVFLWGTLAWCAWNVRKCILERRNPEIVKQAQIAAFFCGGYAAYVMSAVTAHNFYRTWWLGMAMSVVGLAVGTTLLLIKKQFASDTG